MDAEQKLDLVSDCETLSVKLTGNDPVNRCW